MERKYNEEYVEISVDVCKKLAWRFAKGNYELYEEYLSEAYIGATNALITYDENKDAQFSTYCWTCVKREILQLIRRARNKSLKLIYETEDCEIFNLILSDVNIEDEIIYKELYNKTMDYINNNFTNRQKEIIYFKMKHPNYNDRMISEHFDCTRAYINKILKQSREKVKYFIYKK